MKKNFLKIELLAAIGIMLLPNGLFALTNEANVEMTQSEYDAFVEKYDKDYVDYMSQEIYNAEKSGEFELVSVENKYYKNVEYVDLFGNLIETKEVEISKEEYESLESGIVPLSACTPPDTSGTIVYSCWETSSKKIYLNIYRNPDVDNPNYYLASLTTAWKTSPAVRSYDVTGVRTDGVIILEGSGAQLIYYKPNGGGNTTVENYSPSSAGYKELSNGRGYTILLPSKNLTMSDKPIVIGMYQYFFGPYSNYFALYGAYQHATSSVTFDQGRNYIMAAGGKGNVFVFGGSTSNELNNSYDNMQGVSWIHYAQ